MDDCVGGSFCILRGVPTCTQMRMCVQLNDARVLAIQFDFLEEKCSLLCLCCVSSELILALKPFSAKGPNPWLHTGGLSAYPFQSTNSIKCLRNAPDTYISSISFCSGELSANKYNVPVGFNHAPNPLT